MSNFDIYKFNIDEEHAGLRIDSVLSLLLEDISRSYIQKLIEGGNVALNGSKILSKKEKLKSKDSIELSIPEAVSCEAQAEDIPIDIVYEDRDLIVVNKPKGMVVHPAAGNFSGTLVNALLFHCRQNGESGLSTINGVERPGIVHRIDKDTSGLLVCAKSDAALKGLAEQFAVHSINRIYRAVACYSFKEEEGTIEGNIGRDPNNRLKMALVSGDSGKHAVTHWKVLNRFKNYTELSCKLETGRTHQIRVHLASINRPLLGDKLYGSSKQPFGLEGQMLHAGTLGFVHPILGEYMEFTVEPPVEYKEIIEKIKI